MKPAPMQPMKNRWRKKVNKGHKKDAPCSTGCGVEDLLAEAQLANADFNLLFDHFVEKTKCDTDLYKLWGKGVDSVDEQGKKTYLQTPNGRIVMVKKDRKVTSYGSLKGAPRIEQKCLTKYKSRAATTGMIVARYINDVVRGTISFKKCADMLGALNYIEKMENKAVPGLNFKYTVVRIKQIYEPKSPLLYGDVKLNIQIKTANVTHNCELQLNHLDMIKAKGTTNGHGAYETWRNMQDDHWKDEGSELPLSLAAMTNAYRAKALRVVHQSHGAYSDAAKALSEDKKYQAMLAKVKDWSGQIKEKVNNHTIKCYDGTYVQ